MEFIRKIMDARDLQDIVELPNSLRNKKVEILIFSINDDKKKKTSKKSLSGFLSEYANLDLIEKEDQAWSEEATE